MLSARGCRLERRLLASTDHSAHGNSPAAQQLSIAWPTAASTKTQQTITRHAAHSLLTGSCGWIDCGRAPSTDDATLASPAAAAPLSRDANLPHE